jgi:hypothetical protein
MSAPDLAAQRAVLDRVGSLEREQSVLFARQARARAEMVRLWGADPGVLVELAGTARIGQDRAGGQLGRAGRLVEHFPIALGLLELGVMRVGTMEIVLAVTKNCRTEVMELLDERLSERLCELDAVDVRALVAATIPEVEAELDPIAQQERYEQARANRGVWAFPVEDGMARIGAELDQVSARRWSLDFEELVRAQKVIDDRDGVKRTQAQRRADVFAQLPSRVLALADAVVKDKLAELLAQAKAQILGAGCSADAPPPVDVEDELSVPSSSWWCEQEREELLVQLLRLPVRNPVTMNVHVAMTTLLDLDQRSGWLEGIGPVPALQARMLQPVAGLRRVAVDERTGIPLGIDPIIYPPPERPVELDPPRRGRHRRPRARPPTPLQRARSSAAREQRDRLLEMLGTMLLHDRAEPQHDPSAGLREFVQVRDPVCIGPGCPRTATRCDLDHEIAFADGGPTASWNLSPKSTRCHLCRHHGWTVCRDECTGISTGISTWTSPAGSQYQRRSPWQPPTPVPDDLQLPEPRLIELGNPPPDRGPNVLGAEEVKVGDRPLWTDPTPPTPRQPQPEGNGGWDDGPPPF